MKPDFEIEIDSEVNESLDLLAFAHFVLRKYKIVLAAAAIGLLAALIYVFLLATPMYEATAQIYVINSRDSALDLSDLQIGSYLTSDYQLVFNTWEVNQQVIENLQLPYTVKQLQDMVSVDNPSNTRALLITVEAKSGAEAARIANEMAYVGSSYISDTMQTETPRMLSVALEPLEPARPRKMMTLALGVFAGITIALCSLFVKYIIDDKIKTGTDLMKCTGMMPLAIVPVNNNGSGRILKG